LNQLQELLKNEYHCTEDYYDWWEHSSDLTGLAAIEGVNIKLVIVLWYQH
jgi:hypothetical protein